MVLNWDDISQWPCYGWTEKEKAVHFEPAFKALNQWHYQHCLPYKHWVDTNKGEHKPLWSRQFKLQSLHSITHDDVFKTVTSSGTSGSAVSRITLDRHTSALQSKVLTKILGRWIGKQRLPYLVADSPTILSTGASFGARAAGIQGLSFFGRQRVFALDDEFELNIDLLHTFFEEHQGPILLFGFTFILWSKLLKPLLENNVRFSNPKLIILHSGGWKKMQDEAIDNASLKSHIFSLFGTRRVHNFYGMAEQTGTIYVECEAGHLHVPVWADIDILEPYSLQPCELDQQGLIQTRSLLPTSYPGHNILTEDLGVLKGVDGCKCGRKGKYFSVIGRVKAAEARGCSDTFS